ncbi:MAG: glycosyltransferase [Nitrospinae bacterium]|nr:glycosyltransferase [Nitrospinota bacterium]
MNDPDKPLRIALAIPHLGGGGAERSVLKLARGLIERGYRVDILVFEKIDTLADEMPSEARLIELKPGPIHDIHDRIHLAQRYGLRILRFLRRSLLQDARSIAAYIEKEQPDCILPSLPRAKSATLMALGFTNLNPVTIPTVHSVLMNTKRRFRKLYSILFPVADCIIAVSDGVADNLALSLEFPRERISRIYNPADTEEIAELTRAVPDHPWTSDDGPPVILSAGRLARVKDFPTLLRAFAQVSRNREVRLIILGEGNWRRRLEKLIRKLGLQEKVSLPGWVSNPYAFMNRTSVFVLSSKYEGLGNVLIEAMACGCPCVSTDCPAGPAEILDNGRFGPLVPVGDTSALAAAMERVLDSPPDKETLAARAQEFSFDVSVDQYESLILDLVRERRRAL